MAGTGIDITSGIISNTGVLSVVAGTNIAVSGATGNVTVSVTGTVPAATTSTNLAGGTTGSVPYQTSSSTTSFLALGTSGYLMVAGSSAPQYVAPSTVTVGAATLSSTSTIADTSTNSTFYPTFVSAQTGSEALYTDASAALKYNPSTGTLSATTFNGALTGATSGSTLLAGNGSGGLANVTVGSGLLLSGGTLSNTESGGSVTTVSVVTNAGLSGTVANASTTPAITLSVATQNLVDNSTNAATTAYTQNLLQQSMSTIPFAGITGGNYNFNGQGSGCIVAGTASGGTVTGITTIAVAGSGYLVGDILILAQSGSQYNCYLRVAAVSGTGVTTLTILYGGTGYTSGSGLTTTTGSLSPNNLPFTYILAGTLTSNAVFMMTPGTYFSESQQWIWCNNTTGAYTTKLYLSNGSGSTIGSGVTILQGTSNSQATFIFTDGVNDVWDAAAPAPDTGTVTTASVVSANGFAGTVATATTTPAITLSTTITGMLKGNGTAISAGSAGTDYSAGTASLSTGIIKSTTSSGALTIAVAADFPTLNQSTTGNAATVTTNANLTGPITSSGNATSIASQTGTGTTFVMSNSPTLSTPNLGTPSTLVLTHATGAPTWNQSTTGNAATATNISGGTTGQIPYQSSGSTTAFTSGITVATTGTAAITVGSSATMESILIPNGAELMNVIATAPASTTTVYANTGAIQTYTTAATANFIFNFVWSSSTTFNSATGAWTSNTFTIMVLQGATPYYCTSVQVDGTTSGVTTLKARLEILDTLGKILFRYVKVATSDYITATLVYKIL